MGGKGIVFLIVGHIAENATLVFRIIRVVEPIPYSAARSSRIGCWEAFNLQPTILRKLGRHQGLAASGNPMFSATRRNHTRDKQHPGVQIAPPARTLVDELEQGYGLQCRGRMDKDFYSVFTSGRLGSLQRTHCWEVRP